MKLAVVGIAAPAGSGSRTCAPGAIMSASTLRPSGRVSVPARNRPAQRVLERCWFRLEGRFVQSWREGDAWFDEVSYARLASD